MCCRRKRGAGPDVRARRTFKTKGVAQGFLAAAIDTPVSVGDIAAECGAWGIAVLAAFLTNRGSAHSLDEFLRT